MAITTWRQGDTSSTIDDALRDGPGIVAERGLPPDWLAQLGDALAPPARDTD